MRAADRGAQTIVDEYLHNRQVREITFREILVHIGQLGTPYLTSDVSKLAAQYLADKGMKMWRLRSRDCQSILRYSLIEE